jgi:hypothetical protein
VRDLIDLLRQGRPPDWSALDRQLLDYVRQLSVIVERPEVGSAVSAKLVDPQPVMETSEAQSAHVGPQRFKGGKMVFFDDRMELCGVDISTGPSSEHDRNALNILSWRLQRGTFRPCTSLKLAPLVG